MVLTAEQEASGISRVRGLAQNAAPSFSICSSTLEECFTHERRQSLGCNLKVVIC